MSEFNKFRRFFFLRNYRSVIQYIDDVKRLYNLMKTKSLEQCSKILVNEAKKHRIDLKQMHHLAAIYFSNKKMNWSKIPLIDHKEKKSKKTVTYSKNNLKQIQ